jgi:hypothetical protein
LVCLALSVQPASRLAAQHSTPRDTTMSASLLKRLGEAVDGYRTGQPVWVVAGYSFPHEVLGVVSTETVARAIKDSAGPGFGVFGSYTSTRDSGGPLTLSLALHHYPDSKFGDTTANLRQTQPAIPLGDVIDIVVTVHRRNGSPQTVTYRPEEADALFFTLSAVDKFVIPYYLKLYGSQYVTQMRARLERAFTMPAATR